MAKQSGGMPKIDEDFMKELISQGVPAKRESQPDDAPQPGGETETAHEGRQTETVRVEKPTNRKRKGGTDDYRETYFQKVELADRQPGKYAIDYHNQTGFWKWLSYRVFISSWYCSKWCSRMFST